MPKMFIGKQVHDFERKIYDVNSFEDYDRVIQLLKDYNLRRLLQVIAHKPKGLDYIRRMLGKTKIRTKMMLEEIDKLGFLETIHQGNGTFYQAKYNTFIFDVR